jgi:hypothetical protein
VGDIDFDELDKAVNSLMGKVGDKTLEDQDKLNTLDIKDTLKPDEKPKYDTLGKAARGIGDETLESKGERETLEKLEDLDAPQPPTESSTVVALDDVKVPKQETSKKPVSPSVKHPKIGRFMDMMPQAASKPAASTTPDLVNPDRHVPTPPAVAVPVTPPGPSPFLTDAKVEKRPLGGEAPTGSLVSGTDEDTSEEIVEIESINNEKKKLDDGSGDEQRTLNASGFDEEAAAQEQKLQAIESVEAKEQMAESITSVESGDTEKILQEAALPRSKKDAENTENADGNIYDVNNLHQPLGHPAKQKSGWGIVFVILIIIVLAAAVAGAAYFILVKP